ncbi:MAG: glycoside hydrolase family 127 protein [Candidatus Hydrogenedentes bacterium]|nr:glycoside hydrolase family 127 protein [Candidatus Hydrogenedentota bacterium]
MLTAVLTAMSFVAASEKNTIRLHPFPLAQVRLLDGRFKAEQERDRAYLHALDPDRLLFNFRINAGLSAPGTPYGGWEAPQSEVRGHFTGHYLTACSSMYASTGDEELKTRVNIVVAALAQCQQALGGEYLSAFPETFFDRLESGEPVWVPYYTVHKIMAGLCDAYTLCGNDQALDVWERMAAYFKKRIDRLPPQIWDRTLRTEFGGMSEALHNLYALTRKPEDLDLAHAFDQSEFLGPLALGHDNLTHLHGNTQIPKVIGAARRYELTGDVRYRDVAAFFWDRVVRTRTYATGGSTIFEHWPEPDKLAATLGHLNHETCKTHNILKLTRHLLMWTGDTQYADFYERALFNGILGTQGPTPGQLQYYVPMASGCPRQFGTADASFWCCYGTGIESFAKLGDSIYFHDGDRLYVNLYVSSTVNWLEKKLRLEQLTQFPYEDKTTLIIHLPQPEHVSIRLRVPYWIAALPEIHINGKPYSPKSHHANPWLTIERRWKEGDRIEAKLPMNLHTLPLPDDPEQVAILYGPVVLAGMYDARSGQEVAEDNHHETISTLQKSVRPVYFFGDPSRPEQWLEPIAAQPLRFRTKSPGVNIEFIPFDDVTIERYGLYWPVIQKDSAKHRTLELAADRHTREVDRVFVFPHDYEQGSERRHRLQGEKMSAGVVPGAAYVYRHAEPGGWFSWDFVAVLDSQMELLVTYWGGDAGRTFDVVINNQRIATETLQPERPGQTVDIAYPIPQEIADSKDKLTVSFRANHGTMAGGVFGCAVLRTK